MRGVGGVCDGKRFLFASMNLRATSIPSSWGMLEYKEETSAVTRRDPLGSEGTFRSLLMKSLVSLIYEGSDAARGCRKLVAYAEKLSVGESHPEIMGLGGGGKVGLWILGR